MNDEDDKYFALVLAAVAGSAAMREAPHIIAHHAIQVANATMDALKAKDAA
jgi:hypothetical protein